MVKKQVLLAVFSVLSVAACMGSGVAACSSEDSTYYSWHYQSLNELSKQIQTELETAGITRATISARAYGENVISQSTGEVCGFGAMETDFSVDLQTDGLTDINDIGALTEGVLSVLDGFPPDATPGPRQGYITINFTLDDQHKNSLRFLVADGVEARERNLQGVEMLEALGYQQ